MGTDLEHDSREAYDIALRPEVMSLYLLITAGLLFAIPQAAAAGDG